MSLDLLILYGLACSKNQIKQKYLLLTWFDRYFGNCCMQIIKKICVSLCNYYGLCDLSRSIQSTTVTRVDFILYMSVYLCSDFVSQHAVFCYSLYTISSLVHSTITMAIKWPLSWPLTWCVFIIYLLPFHPSIIVCLSCQRTHMQFDGVYVHVSQPFSNVWQCSFFAHRPVRTI
jgi:hypothetical protein